MCSPTVLLTDCHTIQRCTIQRTMKQNPRGSFNLYRTIPRCVDIPLPSTIIMSMDTNNKSSVSDTTLQYNMDVLEEDRVRIVVTTLNGQLELGTLYFEKAKRGFINKPVGMSGWACIDAKVEGLYVKGGDKITPKEIVARCQDLIRDAGM